MRCICRSTQRACGSAWPLAAVAIAAGVVHGGRSSPLPALLPAAAVPSAQQWLRAATRKECMARLIWDLRDMNARFRITVGSEPDFEDLVGNVYFDGNIVLVLTQERGSDSLELELLPEPGGERWTFSLKEFEEALDALKKRMWELRRTEP
jgi:hypothetical protein